MSRWGSRLFPVRLRWKITAVIALVSTLVALALSVTVHFAYAGRLAEQARTLQAERLQLALWEYQQTGQPGLGATVATADVPEHVRRAALDAGTQTVTSIAPAQAGAEPTVWAAAVAIPTTSAPETERHVIALRASYQPQVEAIRSLDGTLALGSLVVIVAGAGAGVIIGERMSNRLRRAAAAATRAAEGDQAGRVIDAVGGGQDEAADLARSVDSLTSALRGRIEAERRVTADIAHELRTPLTGLATAAQLLGETRPEQLVKDRVGALRSLVEDVLEVARLDSATQTVQLSEVPLGDFVTARLGSLSGVTVTVLDNTLVETDPRRLERILSNLASNAVQHGQAPVDVTVQQRAITVRDHGRGFPEDIVESGPRRFHIGDDGSGGHGLGLTIALGQARALGADLSFSNHPDGGALATLVMPENAA